MKAISKLKDDARRHEQREEWEKAIQVYLQVLEISEAGDVELPLYNRIGDLSVRLGRPQEAVRYYEQAADRYAEAGLFNNAIALCNKALRYQPQHTPLLRKLGQFSASQGFLIDARRYFLEYAEREFAAGRIDPAIGALEEYADVSDDVEARELLGRRLVAHGRRQRGVESLRRAWHMRLAAGATDAAAALRTELERLDPDALSEPIPQPVTPVGDWQPDGPTDQLADPLDASGFEVTGAPDSPDLVQHGFPEADAGAAPFEPLDGLETGAPAEAVDAAPLEGFESTALDFAAGDDLEVQELDIEAAETSFDLPLLDEPPPAEPVTPEDAATALDVPDLDIEPLAELDDEGAFDDTPLAGLDTLELPNLDDDIVDTTGHVEELNATDLPLLEGDPLPLLDDPPAAQAETVEVGPVIEADLEIAPLAPDAFASEPLAGADAERAVSPADEQYLAEILAEEPGALVEGAAELVDEADGDWDADDVATIDAVPIDEPDEATVDADYEIEDVAARADLAREAAEELAAAGGTEAPSLTAGAAKPVPPEPDEPADEGFVDLAALLTPQKEDTTRFQVRETDPSGDEDRDFAELLSQFKAKVSEHVPPEDAAAHYDLGLAFKEMGLLDEAIAEFQIALRAEDMRLKVHEELGDCFLQKKQYNIAEKVLRRALDMKYDDELELLGVYYHLGRAYEGMGRVEQARDAYERVLGLDINFGDASARLARL